jgi:lysophospholipase
MHIAKNRVNNLLSETHQAFPPIPDDFNKTGVSLRPTFFGCNPTNSTPEYPLIIYIPNAPPVDGSDPVTK